MSKRKSGSTKPARVNPAVRAESVAGASKQRLAQDSRIGQHRVPHVLEPGQIEQLVAEGRSHCAEIIPKAVKAIEKQLDQGNGNLGLKFLQDFGVLKDEAEIKAGMGSALRLGNLPQTDELAVENAGRPDPPNCEAAPVS